MSSLVYEANARVVDPVYGCTGTITELQRQLQQVKAELAMTQAQLFFMQCQQHQLIDHINANFFPGN